MTRKRIHRMLAAICICLIAGCQDAATRAAQKSSLKRTGSPGIGGDFTLTDQDGKPFRSADHRGKVMLLFFGYTSCAEACPVILSRVKAVYKLLGAEKELFLPVFLSVDPKRDTIAVLKEYMTYFSANAVGLTGKKEEIDQVVKLYGARYEIEKSDSALGYHINHTTSLFLIDQKGKVRFKFKHTDRPELIAAAINQLVKKPD